MQKFLIIIGIIIIALFIAIYFESYIIYFFRLIIREIKHNRTIKRLMNKNKKRRLYKNKILKKYVDYTKSKLEKINYKPKKIYKLDSYLEQRIKYSKFDDKILNELLKNIFEYLNLDFSKISFDIRRTSSKSRTAIAGSYNEDIKKIILEVTTYSSLDKIISTLAHESTHHLLLSNGIELKKRNENEVLTDVTAIYLGFGDYFFNAYKEESRIIYDGEFTELIDRNKLGYIGYGDVKYVQKYSNKVKRKK